MKMNNYMIYFNSEETHFYVSSDVDRDTLLKTLDFMDMVEGADITILKAIIENLGHEWHPIEFEEVHR